MNFSSPGVNQLNLGPASSTESATCAPGQPSAESLPNLPVPNYMTQNQIQGHITEGKGFFNNNISVPALAPVSPRLGYWTESDQASKSCTGKALYCYVYFWRVNQR